ncbi:ATP-dependent zinc protease [Echinicola strongylocentroti]|uniref:ATP-dependent zinc protease n=1 Tax=Echinicola strongylocentroti TaxID=1795355 RepID=A0A2Z4IKM8_9BACT|nr:RimK/LysX family protein [Echinicola strongylocentroti]AWW31269.1 ATP-dependent zinc protease [Echinicola strongylocentroti]
MKKHVIGRREKISLPEWGLRVISAKVDTGAYTNAIHCKWVEEKEVEGQRVLEFKLLSPEHRLYSGKVVRTKRYTQKKVKNSFGNAELRYKVTTKVAMFDETFDVEFTLSDRSKMRNALLLGRKMLRGKFLVDVDQTNLSKKYKVAKQ